MAEGDKNVGAIGYVAELWAQQTIKPQVEDGYIQVETAFSNAVSHAHERSFDEALQAGMDAGKALETIKELEVDMEQLEQVETELVQDGVQIPPTYFLYLATARYLQTTSADESQEVIEYLLRKYEQASQIEPPQEPLPVELPVEKPARKKPGPRPKNYQVNTT